MATLESSGTNLGCAADKFVHLKVEQALRENRLKRKKLNLKRIEQNIRKGRDPLS